MTTGKLDTWQGEGLEAFLSRIGSVLKTQLPGSYWVRAEVLKADWSKGNHLSLELVSYDEGHGAKARAWIWASNMKIVSRFQQSTGSTLKAGLKILFLCRVQFHPDFGLSLVIENVDPKFTLGDMEAKLQAIRERLKSLNEIDNNRQLVRPVEFCHVAVVSPVSAAGLEDFKTIANRLESYNLCKFDYYPALFQGENAVDSIVSAISQVVENFKCGSRYDALAIVRGGGDKAGLYQLNEIKIARCVCRSPIPVLVGVGHERDSTILDEVANCRLPTPSLVASLIQENVVRNARDAKLHLELLIRSSQSMSSFAKQDLRDYRSSISLLSHQKLDTARRQIDEHNSRLAHTPNFLIQSAKSKSEELFVDIKLSSSGAIQDAKELIHDSFRTAINETKISVRGSESRIKQLNTEVMQGAYQSSYTAKSLVQHNYVQMRHVGVNSTHQAKTNVLAKYEEAIQSTKYYLVHQQNRLESTHASIINSANRSVTTIKNGIKLLVERVLLLDPNKILEKGFALIMSADNKALTTRNDVANQSKVTIKLKDGSVNAHILEKQHEQ